MKKTFSQLLFCLIGVFSLTVNCSFAEPLFFFGDLTFGQPPETEMICVKGPCPSEPLRPDIRQNKINLAVYKLPVDITTYGEWEITSPQYSFYEDRLARVSFSVLCDEGSSIRCMDSVASALDREYGLEQMDDFSFEFSDKNSYIGRHYKIGQDIDVLMHHDQSEWRGRQPVVVIESRSLMEELRRDARKNFKAVANLP